LSLKEEETKMTAINSSIFASAATLAIMATAGFAQEANHAPVVVKDLDPFTHVARIPAGSDISSIKFIGAKAVMVPTRDVLSADARYCEQAARRDPGGSMFCPQAASEAYERAYQVTYSFTGPAMASDEQGNTRYTFSVYLRPEELGQSERELLSHRKRAHADVGGSFRVTTSPEFETQMVVDESSSTICEGTYVDGLWTSAQSACSNHIQYKMAAAPSGYIAVRVDAAPSRATVSAALIN
jgi:hypothetical protein